jgi:hypothetical protein
MTEDVERLVAAMKKLHAEIEQRLLGNEDYVHIVAIDRALALHRLELTQMTKAKRKY